MKFKYKNKMIVIISAIIFLISIDRLLKYLAINDYFQSGKHILGGIFKLNYAANYNIAFSLPISGWWLTTLIVLIIIALIYQLLYFIK